MLVYQEAKDGLGLCAHGMERHGRSSKVRQQAGESRALTVGADGEWMAMQWRIMAV